MRAIWRPTAEQLETMTGKEVYKAMREVMKTWIASYEDWAQEALQKENLTNAKHYYTRKGALEMMLDLTEKE